MRNFIFFLAMGLCLPVQAGDIYKCSEGGRTVYREKPCSGAGAVLDLPPAPSRDPYFEARQVRARSLAADIDARNARQAAIDERENQEAARRHQRQVDDKERYCADLRRRHQADVERERHAMANNHGQGRRWAEEEARRKARLRAKEWKDECTY